MTTPQQQLEARWRAEWPKALQIWSRFTQLHEPRWCASDKEARQEKLTDSFAMIRLTDHSIVLNLELIGKLGLADYPREVMAHEIGHHVYCPADLTDEGRLMARIRAALPTHESLAGMVSNLYSDLLINDRLQRIRDLRMNEIYAKLAGSGSSRLWTFYMRACEILWSLGKGTLARGEITDAMEGDAMLAARVIRAYSGEWLRGAGRFAALCFTYLDDESKNADVRLTPWLDAHGGDESAFPDGLVEIDPDEIDGAIHPSLDPAITGLQEKQPGGATQTGDTQPRKRYREPSEYGELLKSIGVTLTEDEIVSRYYRERAAPHLVRFPSREMPQSVEPLAEGLETWDASDALEELDPVETLLSHTTMIPSVTTMKRVYGTMDGAQPKRDPLDLYLGIDCSGSMGNPRVTTSWPVLAGTIIALSALRAGSRVKVVLSGEPGNWAGTPDFIRDEKEILKTLTSYLGTGYAFGIHRLADTFDARKKTDRPVHIVIVTDHDVFQMLAQKLRERTNWQVAKDAIDRARAGGTYVLHMPSTFDPKGMQRMRDDGWNVSCVVAWEDVVAFAREFSRMTFGAEKR